MGLHDVVDHVRNSQQRRRFWSAIGKLTLLNPFSNAKRTSVVFAMMEPSLPSEDWSQGGTATLTRNSVLPRAIHPCT
jgi:hypothetical protein